MRYLVPIVTTIILISLITYSAVVNGGGNELKDIRDMNSVMEDLREAAKILKEKYLRLGKYVDIGNYFGVKTYVISSTILNPIVYLGIVTTGTVTKPAPTSSKSELTGEFLD